MRILIENAMNFMPFEDATVTTPTMEKYILAEILTKLFSKYDL